MSDVLTDADRAAIAATLKAIAPGYERIVDVREVLYLAGKRSGQAQLAAAYQQIAALKAERDTFYMDYRMKCDEQTKALEVQIVALKADAEEREQMLRNARMMVCAMVLSNGGQFHVTRAAMENVASDDYELVQRDEFTTGAFALTVTRAARAEKPHG